MSMVMLARGRLGLALRVGDMADRSGAGVLWALKGRYGRFPFRAGARGCS